jgi:hypothetical protein
MGAPQTSNNLNGFELRRNQLLLQIARYTRIVHFLMAVGASIFLYLGFWVFVAVKEPNWQEIVLLGIGVFCLAAPILRKGGLGKDGGTFEFEDPLTAIDKLRDEAEAAREESFIQMRQQVGAVSTQISDLADLVAAAVVSKSTRKAIVASENESSGEPGIPQIRANLPPVSVPGDPQKGRFGGKEAIESRNLSADVVASAIGRNWQKIVLRVEGTIERPLSGDYVYFFVHDSFDPDAYRVKVDRSTDSAQLELQSFGAFTVGAVADSGTTMLELDLATSANVKAPRPWRDR